MWLAVALLRFTTHFHPIQIRFIAAKSGSSVVETTDLRQGTCSLKFVHQPPLGVHQAQTRYAEASERTSQFKDFQRALAGFPSILIHCQHADAATGLASLCQACRRRSPFMFASPFPSGCGKLVWITCSYELEHTIPDVARSPAAPLLRQPYRTASWWSVIRRRAPTPAHFRSCSSVEDPSAATVPLCPTLKKTLKV